MDTIYIAVSNGSFRSYTNISQDRATQLLHNDGVTGTFITATQFQNRSL